MQNKLLKLLLILDYHTSTSLRHYNITLLKIADIHTVNILSFVNECRAGRNPDIFKKYFTVREATYDFRHKDRLFVPLARTELGFSQCAILGRNCGINILTKLTHTCLRNRFGRE